MTGPRVVVLAYADVGHACLTQLIERDVDVVAVYTHSDAPTEQIWFPSVGRLAHDAGIEVRVDVDFKSPRALADLQALAPDLLLSFYYRELVPAAALEFPSLGAFNMHGSLLPKYRGRAPVNWAVALGEKETGATLHVMTRLADAGDIVDQEAVPIGPDDLAADVQARVKEAAVRVLVRQLGALLAGKAPRRAQDNSAATKYGRRKPQDGLIDWKLAAADIHNLVRAVSHPYPGAFTPVGASTLRIWRTRRATDGPVANAAPGTIVVSDGVAYTAGGDQRWIQLLNAQVDDEPALEGPALAERILTLTTTPPATTA